MLFDSDWIVSSPVAVMTVPELTLTLALASAMPTTAFRGKPAMLELNATRARSMITAGGVWSTPPSESKVDRIEASASEVAWMVTDSPVIVAPVRVRLLEAVFLPRPDLLMLWASRTISLPSIVAFVMVIAASVGITRSPPSRFLVSNVMSP